MKAQNILKGVTLLFSLLILSSFSGGGYKVGDKVEDFKLEGVDGSMVSMAGFKEAKGFIIVFTCNHCPYAKMYEDRIMQLDEKYAALGYPVIAINPNDPERQPEDSFANMKARAEEKGYSFPYVMDRSQDVARRFGAAYTPHTFVLKKEGSDYKVAYIGAIDDNYRDAESAKKFYVESAVDALLENKAPAEPTVKGVGCSIKWKS